MRTIKLAGLKLCRGMGLFALARRLTRHRLRILCYHGFSVGDQHEYSPILFMRGETFRRRMDTLRRLGLRVVSMEEATQLLAENSVAHGEVAITIDDGWKTTHSIAAPILAGHRFPACVYVTTYYCERQTEVFNVVVWYMLWKTSLTTVTLNGIHPDVDGTYDLGADRRGTGSRWIAAVERNVPADRRRAVLVQMAEALGLDTAGLLAGERFKLMSPQEVAALNAEFGLSVELHTHRHRLPTDSAEEVLSEIGENRRLLERWTGARSSHFCYPSGIYATQHPGWLEKAGVSTATTCDAGLNDGRTPRMLLKRYLDRENWSDVEFEAAISGFTELTAPFRAALRRTRASDSTGTIG